MAEKTVPPPLLLTAQNVGIHTGEDGPRLHRTVAGSPNRSGRVHTAMINNAKEIQPVTSRGADDPAEKIAHARFFFNDDADDGYGYGLFHLPSNLAMRPVCTLKHAKGG